VRVFLRPVVETCSKSRQPDGAQRTQENESHAPSEGPCEQQDQQRRHRAAPSREDPDESLRQATLTKWKPFARSTTDVRKRARLAGAEQEAKGDEGKQTPGGTGEAGKGDPEQDNADQDLAGPELIPQPATGHFKQCVGEREGRKCIRKTLRAKVQVKLDAVLNLDNCDTANIGQRGQAAEPGQNSPAHARGTKWRKGFLKGWRIGRHVAPPSEAFPPGVRSLSAGWLPFITPFSPWLTRPALVKLEILKRPFSDAEGRR